MSDEQNKGPEQKPQTEEQSTALEIRQADGSIAVYDYGEDVDSKDMPTSGFLPYLGVLQPLSKALQEGNEQYVEGAKAGMFMLTGETPQVFDGKKGLIFVPLHDRHLIVEKTSLDQKGKTVARHPGGRESEVQRRLQEKFGNNKKAWRSDAGNYMVERHDVTGVLFASVEDVKAMKPLAACIVGFERSKMQAYNRLADNRNKVEPQKRPPLWAGMTLLQTFLDNNDGNDFYNITLKFPVQDDYRLSLISPTEPMFAGWREQCREVVKNIDTGLLKAQEDDGSERTGDDGGKGKGKDIPF